MRTRWLGVCCLLVCGSVVAQSMSLVSSHDQDPAADDQPDQPCEGEGCSRDHEHSCQDDDCPPEGSDEEQPSTVQSPSCSQLTSHLGPFKVDLYPHNIADINKQFPSVSPGGHWSPKDCTPSQRIAIIVPYRDRAEDLILFLNNLHKFLQEQRLHYGVYLVEQADDKHFNRGALLNIGVVESLKDSPYDCLVLHDVDKYPEDTRNSYRCGDKPRHLISKLKYKKQSSYRPNPYDSYFGGVTAVLVAQFKQINGFSNQFWGWGSEDDDLHNRMKFHGLETTRVADDIGKFAEIWHPFGFVNPKRHEQVKSGHAHFATDGVSDVSYTVIQKTAEPLYTLISVNISHQDPFYNKDLKQEL